MRAWSLFPILLVLWAWQWRVLASLLPLFSPSEKCPENKPPCSFKEIDHCGRKKRCSGKMKCCKFNCAKKCVDPDEDVCSLPKEVGLCLALIPRWWYNKETRRCSKFTYGGCAGNNNNFQSEAMCLRVCKPPGESSYRNGRSKGGRRVVVLVGRETVG
uniref:BPTI/Kunitz inhibitor domain-containing protein n=1 Tax=Lynx canadensis TaxID=61383 RepID=A0A667G4I6_LYNCA